MYYHSEEAKRKISIAHTGKPLSQEHRRKIGEGNKGKKLSDEQKANISRALKGKKRSKEQKERIKQGRIGFKPSEETKKKLRGRIPWNKGKTDIYSEETKKKISKGIKGNRNKLGKKNSEETKEKLRAYRLQQRNIMIDTSIELKVKGQLEEKNIFFIHPWNLGEKFQCDFFLPTQNLIIECDGDYWHSRQDMKKRDARKDAYAKKCGYNMLRISENVINATDFSLIDIIRKAV